jgi:hypothetical protein
MNSRTLFHYNDLRAMANTDQMVADLKAMAAGWLECANADADDINRYDAILIDAAPPAGDAMIESDEDRAKRFLAIRDMRMVAVQVRRNDAYELQQYLARHGK